MPILALPDMIQLLDFGEEIAREILLVDQHASLMPRYHLFGPDGGGIFGCPWSCEEEKLAMVELVKQKSREMGATIAMFMAEAWIARSPAGLTRQQAEEWQANALPPSQQPDRQEVVQVCVTDGNEIKTRVLQIKRNEGGAIIALDVEADGPEMLAGRLIDGIIPPRRLH